MSDDKQQQRENIIHDLGAADFKLMTDKQIQIALQERLSRVNEHARKRVTEVMKDEHKHIAEAMTASPFFYLGPEIKIMAGCSARFASLMKIQSDDAYKQVDIFIRTEDPGDLRIGDYLSKHLLAHSLTFFNGVEFAGVHLDAAEYQELRTTDAKKAEEVLTTVRDKRLVALGNLSPNIYQRLIEYYQAFQLTLESITQSQEMDEALGN
jgi:hypothetical protein